jgi:hypothetical protein
MVPAMKEYHLWYYLPLSLEMRVLWLEAKKRESSPTPILLREEDAKAKEWRWALQAISPDAQYKTLLRLLYSHGCSAKMLQMEVSCMEKDLVVTSFRNN